MHAMTSIVGDTHRWNHMNGWGAGWMWLWGPLMILGLVALTVWVVRANAGSPQSPDRSATTDADGGGVSSSAREREIVAERYARGDLSTEEYRERLDELGRIER